MNTQFTNEEYANLHFILGHSFLTRLLHEFPTGRVPLPLEEVTHTSKLIMWLQHDGTIPHFCEKSHSVLIAVKSLDWSWRSACLSTSFVSHDSH